MPKKKYFGTDGIRGEVGKSLVNPEFMLKLGWAAGNALAQHGSATVLIGKDTRISGYMIESALLAGFSAAGVDSLLVGPMPTPAIAYLTQSIRAQAGVVISASHNPYHDNGVKFFDRKGFKLSDELEFVIEELLDSPLKTVPSEKLGKAARMVDAAGRYIEFCKSTFPSYLSLKGLKVVVDCAHGATYSVAPKIFHELGAKVTSIADKPDGLNINQKCGAIDTRSLQAMVVENKADLGIALDGDGDRVIMVDHEGEVVNGDEILGIIAIQTQGGAYKHEGVVGTLMSNLGLEQALNSRNITFERSQVGDRHVLEMLKQKGWKLGGESSGHIVDLRYTTTGDGVVTALQILRIMQESSESLAKLKKVITKRPQVLINVPVKNDTNIANYPQIEDEIAKVTAMIKDRGRILLRSSGTEPVIRVMVEGNDESEVQQVAKHLADSVAREIADNNPSA